MLPTVSGTGKRTGTGPQQIWLRKVSGFITRCQVLYAAHGAHATYHRCRCRVNEGAEKKKKKKTPKKGTQRAESAGRGRLPLRALCSW